MRRFAAAAALSVGVIAGVGVTALAAPTAPKITGMKVNPSKVCRTRSDTCPHPGSNVTFKLSQKSKVTADCRPVSTNLGPVILFKRTFKAGKRTRHFSVEGLAKGKYILRLTATDAHHHDLSHPAERHFKPRVRLSMLIAGAVSLFAGVFLALIWEHVRNASSRRRRS